MQLTTDDLGTPLAEATFVIVDLETTGGSPREGGITEIGAVKVRGGTVIGELATLVNPGQPIPPFIAALTGITDPMVAVAPAIAPVLASFLEFLADATLVAHNAPYDVGFLKGACSRADLTWPATRVLDTARIARTALLRDEVPNCRLETLARHFGTAVQPTHRALDDARATVEVFHALLERLGALGVHSVEELQTFTSRVNPVQRAKRTLADGLPHAPGVYVFKDPQGHPLYIGTSSNIARRVRTYFTASETRRRMTEMVRIAETVEAITCVTRLEAQVREIRLIAKEQPRYNRRGRRPGSQTWIRVDTTGGVALRLVQHISSSDDGVHHLGPWSSKSAAEPTRRALDWVLRQSPAAVAEFVQGSADECQQRLWDQIQAMSAEGHYEAAAQWRDGLFETLTGLQRTIRLQLLARTAQVLAVRPVIEGGRSDPMNPIWEAHCFRYGSLAGAARWPTKQDCGGWARALEALDKCSAQVEPPVAGALSCGVAEAELVARWLELPGVRLASVSTPLAWPARSGGMMLAQLAQVSRPVGPVTQVSRPVGPVGGMPTRIRRSGSEPAAGQQPALAGSGR
ncbi:MAG: DEDD exonuclease domain-containing protein [Actinomycetales bacterium]